MGAIEALQAAVEAQSTVIASLTTEVMQLREKIEPTRETYTLADVAALPESPSLKTLRNYPARQPNYGKPDGYVGSRKAWYRETVEAWRRQLSPAPGGRGFARTKELGGAA